jgi:hypothetical protein
MVMAILSLGLDPASLALFSYSLALTHRDKSALEKIEVF